MRRAAGTWTGVGLVALSALLIAGAAPDAATAKTKKVKSTDRGDFFALASFITTVKRPKKTVTFKAGSDRPGERVEADWDISCSKKFRFETRDGNFSTTSSSAKRKVRLPIKNAKSCTISASADWDIFDEPGFEPRPTTVTIQLRAKQRKKK